MKPSKPVSFPTPPRRLFARKFWTKSSVCLDAQFVSGAVGVAPLPCRLWILSYPDTMNRRSSAHLLWTVCYGFTHPETLNNSHRQGRLRDSPRLRPVLAFIFYSAAPKFSPDWFACSSFSWLFSPLSPSLLVRVPGWGEGRLAFATRNMQHNVQKELHFFYQTCRGGGGGRGGCRIAPVHVSYIVVCFEVNQRG